MSCYLRLYGENLDIDGFLAGAEIEADKIWHKGDPGFIKSRGPSKASGASFLVSDADFDQQEIQIEDALEFIKTHAEFLTYLRDFPNIGGACFDFGFEIKSPYFSCYCFPPALLLALGQSGIWLELSTYPLDLTDEAEDQGDSANAD